MSPAQQAVIRCLLQAQGPLLTLEIAPRVGMDEDAVAAALSSMEHLLTWSLGAWSLVDRELAALELNAAVRAGAFSRALSALCAQAGA